MPFNHGSSRPGTTVNATGAVISFSSSGDNTVVSAVAGQSIRVYRMTFVVSADTVITIKDGASTGLTGAMTFFAGGAYVLEWQDVPWYTTTTGNAFIINQTGTAQVSGRIEFQQP